MDAMASTPTRLENGLIWSSNRGSIVARGLEVDALLLLSNGSNSSGSSVWFEVVAMVLLLVSWGTTRDVVNDVGLLQVQLSPAQLQSPPKLREQPLSKQLAI